MKMRKLLAIVMTLALVMSFSVGALAAAVGTSTIKIDAGTDDITGRTFDAYILFTVSEVYKDATSGDETYNYVATDLLKAVVDSITNETGWTNQQYVVFMRDLTTAEARGDFSDAFYTYLETNTTVAADLTLTGNGTTATATDVPYGYYIIIETNTNLLGAGASPMIFALGTTAIEIDIKADFEEFDKSVTDAGSVTIDGDYFIGQELEYTLTAKYPTILDDYTVNAYHVFSDSALSALDIDLNSVKLYIGTSTTPVFSVSNTVAGVAFTPDDANNSFVLKVDYMLLAGTYSAGDAVKVVYNATITPYAVTVAIENKAGLDFPNNPGSEPFYKYAKAYTYNFQFNKVDEDGVALGGAEFELRDSEDETNYTTFTFTKDANDVYYYDANGSAKLTSGSDGEFRIAGLDEGKYYLVETKSPDGYNILENAVVVEINAIRDGDGFATVAYTVTKDGTQLAGISFDVVNVAGILIPGTGGIGTTLFTIFGGVIILGAFTLLIANRKRIFGK